MRAAAQYIGDLPPMYDGSMIAGHLMPDFPTATRQVAAWERSHGVPRRQAIRRFIAYAVLDSIAGDDSLKDILALRGSSALAMFYGLNRCPSDLDFVHCRITSFSAQENTAIIGAVNAALSRGLRRHFPDYGKARPLLLHSIKVEVCPRYDEMGCNRVQLNGDGRCIRVCHLEYLLAEKLLGLLLPSHYTGSRGKHVYDICQMCRTHRIDIEKLRRYFWAGRKIQREQCYGVPPVPPACFDQDAKRLALQNFDSLAGLSGKPSFDFQEGWECVLALAAKLPQADANIPAQPFSLHEENYVAASNS